MRIAIAEDYPILLEGIRRIVENYFHDRHKEVVIDQFFNGQQLLACLDEGKAYDIYLLDIEMPEINGLLTAERIRQRDKVAHIVFVTAFERYAVDGYQYRAMGYVMKERCEEQLPGVFDRILEEEARQESLWYQIMNEQRYVRFPIREILYLSRDGKNTVFHCRGGAEYTERISLEKVYQKLDPEEFIYVNRGEIVNLRHVIQRRGSDLVMEGHSSPISRSQLPLVKEKIVRYWGRGR